ncbi:hypothetical protein EQG79_04645 [Spirosoma sordidisoli]|uniref:DM13 domain-containing protein n=2 Tax=Cytophagaceae TaxID=89373 RepID=A0A4Q2UPX0_9BACT|nr:hypothetical protein EQG79_04645 [Spirosoma sordidisoli]
MTDTMKTLLFVSLLALGLLVGCSTTEETINPGATTGTAPVSGTATVGTPASSTTTTGQAGGLQGMFVSNVHPTSGTVSVQAVNGKQTLVFTNFRTDGGPDLRIYLAENTGLRNFIEVSRLNSTSGTFSVELPTSADPARQRFVIIWCKAFSVLFGNAELK